MTKAHGTTFAACKGSQGAYSQATLNAPARSVMLFEMSGSGNFDVSTEADPEVFIHALSVYEPAALAQHLAAGGCGLQSVRPLPVQYSPVATNVARNIAVGF